jgi:hypothetical protein
MSIALDRIENPQEMLVRVLGPGDADTLLILTGTAVFTFKGVGSNVLRDTLSFEVGPTFDPGQVRGVVATASLASIFNDGPAIDAGWAVDSVEAFPTGTYSPGRVRVTAALAVRDIDGFIFRIAYQVNILAHLGGSPYSSSGSSRAIGEESL